MKKNELTGEKCEIDTCGNIAKMQKQLKNSEQIQSMQKCFHFAFFSAFSGALVLRCLSCVVRTISCFKVFGHLQI